MRDYDPTTGRYLEPDPLGLVDGASVYGYVKGNPGNFVDFFGLVTLVIPGDPSGLGLQWMPDPSHGDPTGLVYKNRCSEERLTFHFGTPGTRGHGGKNHWHLNPDGNMSPSSRYRHNADPSADPPTRGRDYLLEGDVVEVCGCDDTYRGVSIPVPDEETSLFMSILGIMGLIGGTLVLG